MEYPPYHTRIPNGSMPRFVMPYGRIRHYQLKTTTLNIEGEIVEIPICMLENGNLFKSIFTKQVFYSLPVHIQQYLCKFLPLNNVKTLDEHLAIAFTPYPVFNYSNNFEKLRIKLRNNHFDPNYLNKIIQIREIKRVLFEHFYRQYNLRLMRKLFISRHEILERASLQGDKGDLNQIPPPSYKANQKESNEIECKVSRRANIRVKRMLDKVKRLANDPNPYSSDEEEVVVKEYKEVDYKSSIYNSKMDDFDLHEPSEKTTIKEMLKEYKKLKECHPTSPSLDTEGIKLFDVYGRAGLSVQLEKNFGTLQKDRIEKRLKLPYIGGKRK